MTSTYLYIAKEEGALNTLEDMKENYDAYECLGEMKGVTEIDTYLFSSPFAIPADEILVYKVITEPEPGKCGAKFFAIVEIVEDQSDN